MMWGSDWRAMHTLKPTKRAAALWLCLSVLPGGGWAQQDASEQDVPAQAEPQETAPAPSENSDIQPEGDSMPPAPRAFKPSEEVHADTILTMPADF